MNLVYLTFGVLVTVAGLFAYNKVYLEFNLGERYDHVDGEEVAMWIGSNVVYMGLLMCLLTLVRMFIKDFMSFFLVFGILIIAYGFTMRIKFGIHKLIEQEQEQGNMSSYIG